MSKSLLSPNILINSTHLLLPKLLINERDKFKPGSGPFPEHKLTLRPDELKFEEGLQEIRKRVESFRKLNTRSFLIAIYGAMDSGKSHLIDRLYQEFCEMNLISNMPGSAPSQSDFTPPEHLDIRMFHCAWWRIRGPGFDHEDPNVLARLVGCHIDVNVLLYNPNHLSPNARATLNMMGVGSDLYDIVISNSLSHEKS